MAPSISPEHQSYTSAPGARAETEHQTGRTGWRNSSAILRLRAFVSPTLRRAALSEQAAASCQERRRFDRSSINCVMVWRRRRFLICTEALMNRTASDVPRKPASSCEIEGRVVRFVDRAGSDSPSKKKAIGACSTSDNSWSSARADPVITFFVFLQLLKGDADRLSHLGLCQVEHHTAHAHPAADIFVDEIGVFGHASPLALPTEQLSYPDRFGSGDASISRPGALEAVGRFRRFPRHRWRPQSHQAMRE